MSLDWDVHGSSMLALKWRANGPAASLNRRKPGISFASILLSDKGALNDQIVDVQDFLVSNEPALSGYIREAGGGEIDFGISAIEVSENVFCTNRRFPPSLTALIARFGLVLNVSIYWNVSKEHSADGA